MTFPELHKKKECECDEYRDICPACQKEKDRAKALNDYADARTDFTGDDINIHEINL